MILRYSATHFPVWQRRRMGLVTANQVPRVGGQRAPLRGQTGQLGNATDLRLDGLATRSVSRWQGSIERGARIEEGSTLGAVSSCRSAARDDDGDGSKRGRELKRGHKRSFVRSG